MPLRACNARHCIRSLKHILEVYSNPEWSISRPILTEDDMGVCYAIGRFMSTGIKVEVAHGSMRDVSEIQVNAKIMMSGKDLQRGPVNVAFSQRISTIQIEKYTVLVILGGKVLPVTGDHIFLLSNRKLITADRLTKEHFLLSPNGQPVPIKGIYVGEYASRFQHVSVSRPDTEYILASHFLNTNGVISGDSILPFFFHDRSISHEFVEDFEDLPVVGSYEYVKKHGDECLNDPPAGSTDFIKVMPAMPPTLVEHIFVPLARTLIKVPDNAHCFLSKADANSRIEDRTRPLSDPVIRDTAEEALRRYRGKFRNIVFNIDWSSHVVNGCAWKEEGKQFVIINGRLALQTELEIQGLALVIAHEVAHHIGGGDLFPDGLSCEGQSDFAGVSIVLRRLVGLHDHSFIRAAIDQMAKFYNVANSIVPSTIKANCSHPDKKCRIATYHAALRNGQIPECAI